jgi:hypothetical protein
MRSAPVLHRYCEYWKQERNESYDFMKDILDAKDWEELEHFKELLKPFERVTKRTEGNAITGSNGALWEVIPIIDYLFTILQKHADKITAIPHLFTDHY